MTYKKDFSKRERVDTTKEKGYYSGIKVIKEPPLRKEDCLAEWNVSSDCFKVDDEFMKKVEEKGYILGPDKHIEFEKGRNWYMGDISRKEYSEPGIYSVLKQASDNFVLENFTATRNSETGKIDLITSTWDGSSTTRDECPEDFDNIVRVLEKNPGSAQIFNRNDFM